MHYPTPIAKLIDSYMKLPGIGQKTATRLAFYTINMQEEDVTEFAKISMSRMRSLSSNHHSIGLWKKRKELQRCVRRENGQIK